MLQLSQAGSSFDEASRALRADQVDDPELLELVEMEVRETLAEYDFDDEQGEGVL